jgi:thiol-disulfide isomerase/thioredoxin
MAGDSNLSLPQSTQTKTDQISPEAISSGLKDPHKEIANQINQALLLDFFTTQKGSKQLRDQLASFEKHFSKSGQVSTIHIDAEDPKNQDLTKQYGVTLEPPIPTLLYLDAQGQVKKRQVGVFYDRDQNDQQISEGLSAIIPNSSADQILRDVRIIDTKEAAPAYKNNENKNLEGTRRKSDQSEQTLSAGKQFIELTEELGRPGLPKVLHFSMEGCGPCKQLEPVLEKARKKFADKVDVIDIDVNDSKYKKLIEHLSLNGVPALLYVDKQGTLADVIIGFDKSVEGAVGSKFEHLTAKKQSKNDEDLAALQDKKVEQFREISSGKRAREAERISNISEYMSGLGRPGHFKIAEFYIDGHKVCKSAHNLMERLKKSYGEKVDFLQFDLNDPIGNKIAKKYLGSPSAGVAIVNPEGLYYTCFYSNDQELEDRLRSSLKQVTR